MQHHAERIAYLGLMVAVAAIAVWSMLLLLLVTFAVHRQVLFAPLKAHHGFSRWDLARSNHPEASCCSLGSL